MQPGRVSVIGATTSLLALLTVAPGPIGALPVPDSPYVTHTFGCVGHQESFVAPPSGAPSLVVAIGGSGGGGQTAGVPLGLGGVDRGPVALVGGETGVALGAQRGYGGYELDGFGGIHPFVFVDSL